MSLSIEKHVKFLIATASDRGFEWIMSEYLRMSGIYWSLTALYILGAEGLLPKEELLEFVKKSQSANGGFCPAPGHFPSIVYTLSAIQILVTYDELESIDLALVTTFIQSLQNEDGSFRGYPEEDPSESDTRYGFCALGTLKLIGQLNENVINICKAGDYILKCQNFDGGFGVRVGSESHAGQVFCATGSLKLLNRLQDIDTNMLGFWLAERQLDCGGLNGRPMKREDVCYSWWVLSALNTLDKSSWIDSEKLKNFILSTQDDDTGGFADRPGDYPDPFHTLFGIAALSLMYHKNEIELDFDLNTKSEKLTHILKEFSFKKIDPLFCMPTEVLNKLKD